MAAAKRCNDGAITGNTVRHVSTVVVANNGTLTHSPCLLRCLCGLSSYHCSAAGVSIDYCVYCGGSASRHEACSTTHTLSKLAIVKPLCVLDGRNITR